MKLPLQIERFTKRFRKLILEKHPLILLAGTSTGIALLIVAQSQGSDESRTIFRREGPIDFKNASILGNPGKSILLGEERQFSKTQKQVLDSQKELKTEIESLRDEIRSLKGSGTPPSLITTPISAPIAASTSIPNSTSTPTDLPTPEPLAIPSAIRLSPAPESYGSTSISLMGLGHSGVSRKQSGSSLISFPVKSTGKAYLKVPGIILPAGSYVKAKLLTGIEAPEGKTYPVLMQLDFAYIIPNQKRLDLAGCFIIAKAQGDLSTERVQMQATKLSCVSKSAGMFEREINGFIADDADNSFAVMGRVNTKQDRVAATAFLSSVVSGIGKAIQQAQTTNQTTPLGGGQSVVTGDQGKYIAGGAASESATLVTQWYLKQAQNLLPTINVGSGQEVWVIMQDQVDLPKDYFTQNSLGGSLRASIYTHFTRLSE